jgi:hypothetical protein
MKGEVMLKNIIKISIRLFILFWIFQFISIYASTLNYWINLYNIKIDMNGINIDNIPDNLLMDKQDIFNMFLRFIITVCANLAIVVILWIKNEKVANAIIGKNDIENVQITSLDSENILSIGLCVICIYFFIESVTKLLYHISLDMIYAVKTFDENTKVYVSPEHYLIFPELLLKLIMSIVGIRYKEKIVKKININNGKNKSNGI